QAAHRWAARTLPTTIPLLRGTRSSPVGSGAIVVAWRTFPSAGARACTTSSTPRPGGRRRRGRHAVVRPRSPVRRGDLPVQVDRLHADGRGPVGGGRDHGAPPRRRGRARRRRVGPA